MNPMVLVDNKAPDGTYEVVVKFIVKSDGTLADIAVESNPGYGTAQEAIRLIKISPSWIPASKFGHNVDAYRRQPISFSINN
jgi:protein TonB